MLSRVRVRVWLVARKQVRAHVYARKHVYGRVFIRVRRRGSVFIPVDRWRPPSDNVPPPLPPRLKNNYLLPTLRVCSFPRGGSSPYNFSRLITHSQERPCPINVSCMSYSASQPFYSLNRIVLISIPLNIEYAISSLSRFIIYWENSAKITSENLKLSKNLLFYAYICSVFKIRYVFQPFRCLTEKIYFTYAIYAIRKRGWKSLIASRFKIVDFNFCIAFVHSAALINNFKIHLARRKIDCRRTGNRAHIRRRTGY